MYGGIGDIWRDYGRRRRTDGVNQQGFGFRRDIVWLLEKNTDPNTVWENRKCARFSAPLTKGKSSEMDFRCEGSDIPLVRVRHLWQRSNTVPIEKGTETTNGGLIPNDRYMVSNEVPIPLAVNVKIVELPFASTRASVDDQRKSPP
jgi:hypothetical protein